MTKEWNCFNISLYFSGYSPWLFALYKGVGLGNNLNELNECEI